MLVAGCRDHAFDGDRRFEFVFLDERQRIEVHGLSRCSRFAREFRKQVRHVVHEPSEDLVLTLSQRRNGRDVIRIGQRATRAPPQMAVSWTRVKTSDMGLTDLALSGTMPCTHFQNNASGAAVYGLSGCLQIIIESGGWERNLEQFLSRRFGAPVGAAFNPSSLPGNGREPSDGRQNTVRDAAR